MSHKTLERNFLEACSRSAHLQVGTNGGWALLHFRHKAAPHFSCSESGLPTSGPSETHTSELSCANCSQNYVTGQWLSNFRMCLNHPETSLKHTLLGFLTLGLSNTWEVVECRPVQPLWEAVWRYLRKFKMDPTSGNIPKETQNTNSKEQKHPYIHGSVIYNHQDMEAAQVSISRWVDKNNCGIFTQWNSTRP